MNDRAPIKGTIIVEAESAPGDPAANFILTTKLKPPQLRSDIISRPQLIEKLEFDSKRPFTLISAPAGYGKSTLAAQWLEVSALPGVWLSLDKDDNDLRTFLLYFVAAIRCQFPSACQDTYDLLITAELPRPEYLGSMLANDLEDLDQPFMLVLDDYHCINDVGVHNLLSRLLEHPSRSLHLVIVSRRDPPFRISAMRTAGLAVEIRESDLQFSRDETGALFQELGERFPESEILTKIMVQLEGWVVGLRMVLLGMAHSESPAEYLAGLQTVTTDIREYLVQQVLSGQSADVRARLLVTSIFDRFCASLVDALAASGLLADGQNESEAVGNGETFLRILEEKQLFVVGLGGDGEWIRYHHFFQQNLRMLLQRQCSPEELAALHLCASEWFEHEGLIDEAIHHALAADDHLRAAEIIERHRHRMFDLDRWFSVQKWLSSLPADPRQQRPGLLFAEAWIAFINHRGEQLVRIVEQVDSLVDVKTIKLSWLAELSLYKGMLDYTIGQGKSGLAHFEKAAAYLQHTQGIMHGELELWLCLSLCMVGKVNQAIERLTHGLAAARKSDGIFAARLNAGLFFVRYLSGDLVSARNDARRVYVIALKQDIAYTRYWADFMEVCTYLQSNQLQEAAEAFATASRQPEVMNSQTVADALAALALTRQLLHEDEAAGEALEILRQFAWNEDPGLVHIADSCKARLAILRGKLDWAVRWANSFDEIPPAIKLTMWVEVPMLTKARVLIAEGSALSLENAVGLLETFRQKAEGWCFVPQVIEATVLQSVALEKQGKGDAALETLCVALSLCEPGGWVRPYVEAGPIMAVMLERLPAGHTDDRFVSLVRSLISESENKKISIGNNRIVAQSPVDPLTNRELDVLELLVKRLYDKEIAKHLNISPATVRTHLKHIYAKLDVKDRRKAVQKANEMGIL